MARLSSSSGSSTATAASLAACRFALAALTVASCARLASGAVITGLTETGVQTRAGFLQSQRDLNATDKEAVNLYASLRAVHYTGNHRLDSIEAKLAKAFQALPKDDYGRLQPRAARHLVHTYFAKEHGWLLTGLEPHGHNQEVSEMHEVVILEEQAPSLASLIEEATRSGHGLSLHDSAALTATIERLILDRSVDLLVTAYGLNGEPTTARLDEDSLHEVLSSFLVLFEFSEDAKPTSPAEHQEFKELAMDTGKNWDHLVEFLRDTIFNLAFTQRHTMNPFVPPTYTFDQAASFVDELTLRYGKWQDAECHLMTDFLEERSSQGLVPLHEFYSVKLADMEYEFSESLSYLEEVGALDQDAKAVRIANYIAGPSNCIAASKYFSICCISECNEIIGNIEAIIQGPAAEPEILLHAVANISSRFVDAPRKLEASLVDKLETIADKHDGLVPLHGRLFAQWLFFAFPNECPYPHIVQDSVVLTSNYWLNRKSSEMFATPEISAPPANSTAPIWSDEEVLPLVDAPVKAAKRVADFTHYILLVAPIALVSRIAWDMAKSAWEAATMRRLEKQAFGGLAPAASGTTSAALSPVARAGAAPRGFSV